MTFTIQGVAPTAVGGTGGGLGFAGTTKSVAIKFDLFDNAGEGPNSTGLYLNGVQPNAVNSINLTGTGIDLHSGHTFNVSMAYNGTTLTVTITDSVTLATATQNYTVDIPTIVGGNTAYVGFTGGTGGLTAVQKVLNWTFSNPTPSAPADDHEHTASADANQDGFVDGADYIIWADNIGRVAVGNEHVPGDFNYSGTVDGADYILWADTFSPPPAAPQAASIPLAAAAASVPVVVESPGESAEAAVAVMVVTAEPAAVPVPATGPLQVAVPVPAAALTAHVEQPPGAQVGTPVQAVVTANARPLVIDSLLANEERVTGLIAAIRGGSLREEARLVELSANLERQVEEFFATTSWARRLSRRDK